METAIDNTQPSQEIIIQNSIELFKNAPQILRSNQQRTEKAVIVGNDILSKWQEAWAIENEDDKMAALAAIDERSNKFMVNCATALVSEKELRAALTQMMDEFKKMFTAAEFELDKTKSGTVAAKVQSQRNDYVKTIHEVQERKRKEAERVAAKQKEAVELRSTAEVRLAKYYNDYLAQTKMKLQNSFNAITLEDFTEKSDKLKSYQPSYAQQHFDQFSADLYSSLHTKEELAEITANVKGGKYDDLSANYAAELSMLRDELVDQLPSKLSELQEQKRLADEAAAESERQRLAEEQRQKDLAAANEKKRKELEAQQAIEREEEQKRLAAIKKQQDDAAEEQRQREQEERERIAKEQEEAGRKAEQDAELKKQGDQTMIMFEQEAAIADTTVVPEARTGFDIEVLHPVGYAQIFQLWFEQEGKNLPTDKIGNTKLDQMKAWAEKQAHKTDTKIESKFLKYAPSFKAVARKSTTK